jgi:L-asparagine transporter-like permease
VASLLLSKVTEERKIMKKLMTIGGLIGFGVGIVSGLAENCSWPAILFRSSVAAFLASILLRWWGKVWMVSLQQAYFEQVQAAAAAESAASRAPASSSPNKR